MTFAVNRAARRTFYLERYPDHWEVVRVWEPGSAVDGRDVQELVLRAYRTEPQERWMAEQAEGQHTRAPWHSVVLSGASDGQPWQVSRYYSPDQELRPSDLYDDDRVLVVASVIIPRPRPGQRGVQLLTRDSRLAIDAARAAGHILHGELPTDSGHA